MTTCNTYINRKKNNLCVICGNPKGETKLVHCNECNILNNLRTGKDKQKLKEKKLCLHCRKPTNNNKLLCNDCLKKAVQQSSRLRERKNNNNLCRYCGKYANIVKENSRICNNCWFKGIARGNTGSSKNWNLIKNLLEKQNYKCAYTGKKLIIGENASIDHIIPRSKGGSNEIQNLQWVDKDINEMKNDFTHEEFINTIKIIINHLLSNK